MAKRDDSDHFGRAAAVEPGVSGGALRITLGEPGTAVDLDSSAVNGSRATLTIEQEAQVRVYFDSSTAFFALLDIWLRAGERGEATTPKQVAMLRFAGRVLCKQHDEVAPLLQRLVH
jgi:hypothetical protein